MDKRLTILIVAGLAAAGGCGDSGEDGPSKAQFLEKGNAICKKGNEQLDASIEKTFGSREPNGSELARFAKVTLVPNVRDQISRLGRLELPAEDGARFERLFADAQLTIDKVENNPSLIAGKDPFASINKRARALGLTTCGG